MYWHVARMVGMAVWCVYNVAMNLPARVGGRLFASEMAKRDHVGALSRQKHTSTSECRPPSISNLP